MTTFFVGGCMRSGTSVLQAVLCSTEETNPLIHEAQYLTNLVRLHVYGRESFERYLCHYFDTPGDVRAYHAGLIEQFLARTLERYRPARHLVLKNPEMTPLFAEMAALVADARFIVAVRDPRDTIASILDVAERQAAQGHSTNLTAMNGDAEKLSAHYNAYYSVLAGGGETDFQGRLLAVKIEDLLREPERTAAALAELTGLSLADFDPGRPWRTIVDYADAGLAAEPFHSSLRGKPLTAARIGCYAERLSPSDIATIERNCDGIMRAFGYLD